MKKLFSIFLVIVCLLCFTTVVFGAYRTGTSEEIFKSAENLSSYYEKLSIKIFSLPSYQLSDSQEIDFQKVIDNYEIIAFFAIDSEKYPNYCYFTIDIYYSDGNGEKISLPQLNSSAPYLAVPSELVGTAFNFTVKLYNGSNEMKLQTFKGAFTRGSVYQGEGKEVFYPAFSMSNPNVSAPLSYYYNPETDDWQTSPYKPQSPFEDPSSTTASEPSPVIKNCGNRG